MATVHAGNRKWVSLPLALVLLTAVSSPIAARGELPDLTAGSSIDTSSAINGTGTFGESFVPLPDGGLQQFSMIACKQGNTIKGTEAAIRVEGNAVTSARSFVDSTEGFGGHLRSNADIEVAGRGYVDGNATPGTEHTATTRGKGVVTGSTDPATGPLDCSQAQLTLAAEQAKENHQNAAIPTTDQGRSPWGSILPDDPWPFQLRQGDVVRLPTGVYWFSSWSQAENSQVIVDGFVQVLLTGALNLASDAVVNVESTPYDLVIYAAPPESPATPGEWALDDNNVFRGLIYAPTRNAQLAGQAQLQGTLLAYTIKATGQARIVRWIDEDPPDLTFTAPTTAVVNTGEFPVRVSVVDTEAGLNPHGMSLHLDGTLIDFEVTAGDPFLHSVELIADLTDVAAGEHQISARAYDRAGNMSEAFMYVTVATDLVPPTITATVDPVPNAAGWNNTDVIVTFACADDQTGVAACSDPMTTTGEGTNQEVTGTAVDNAGNSASISVSINIDKTPPTVFNMEPADGAVVDTHRPGISAEFSDSLSGVDAASASILLDTVNVTSQATVTTVSIVLAVNEDLAVGSHSVMASVADLAGNTSAEVTSSFTIEGVEPPPTGELPPDPATIAPTLNPTAFTSMADATAFLYTGPEPIQSGVAPGTIEPMRAAVIRGLVMTRDGAPLPGAIISILDHPELGETLSRSDGMFDLAVNGGGILTIDYHRDGYLPSQRTVDVPWQKFVWAPDVVLIPLDPNVTSIDLTSGVSVQVARGSSVTDQDGSRRGTLLFPQGTTAEFVFSDGSRQPVSELSIRITEYTIGLNGPLAMPAELPVYSGYTYAFELTADEAIDRGAVEVSFGAPLPFYVENFLGFPVGTVMPVGFYNREIAAWLPSENGRVVEIVALDSGVALLDTDGDGVADDPQDLLDVYGITAPELVELGGLYAAGSTLWRLLIPHFSPVDANPTEGPPEDAERPEQDDPETPDATDDPCDPPAIECDNQTMADTLDLVGVPFSLTYRSDRVVGRDKMTMDIDLTGDEVPGSLQGVVVQVNDNGTQTTYSYSASPNQSTSYTSSGINAYGQSIGGSGCVDVSIGYVYRSVYYTAAENDTANAVFASLGSRVTASNVSGRTMWTAWQNFPCVRSDSVETVGGWDARGAGLGGWTLSVHHTYDPKGQILYRGDGRTRSATDVTDMDSWVLAGGTSPGYAGDGGPAAQALFANPFDVAAAPDGSIYVADANNHRVRKIDTDGIIDTIAGGGVGFCQSGDVATECAVSNPRAVAFGPDGDLYIAAHNAWRVDAQGLIWPLEPIDPSTGSSAGSPGPWNGMDVGPDGSAYFVNFNSPRVWRRGPGGEWAVVAGTEEFGFSGDGGSALDAQLGNLRDVAVGLDGSLYIADAGNIRIRRVSPVGIIESITGEPHCGVGIICGNTGDGGLAVNASIDVPRGLSIADDGALLICTAGYPALRRIGSDGIITSMPGDCGFGLDVDPSGDILTANGPSNPNVSKAGFLFPSFTGDAILLAATDGAELYEFSEVGRHLRTLDALTGSVQLEFQYDGDGHLVGVEDPFGNVTSIERDVDGDPLAIVGPYGQRTGLALDANGYLAEITNPAGETHHMTYTSDGLLQTSRTPAGREHTFTYDGNGRLVRAVDPSGAIVDLSWSETEDGFVVTKKTGLGLVETYSFEEVSDGTRSVFTDTSGASIVSVRSTSSSEFDGERRVTTYPTGMVVEEILAPDPRWGMQAPVVESRTLYTQAGATVYEAEVLTERLVSIASGLLDLVTLTETTTLLPYPYRIYTSTYEAATGEFTLLTPEGRTRMLRLDTHGRPVAMTTSGLDALSVEYDQRGRVASVSQGTSQLTYTYDTLGGVDTISDVAGGQTRYEYDAAGRTTLVELSSGRVYRYEYDADGYRTAVIMPSGARHELSYDQSGRFVGYRPADGSQVQIGYDTDGNRSSVQFPTGRFQDWTLDASGRLSTINGGDVAIGFTYETGSGQLATSSWASSAGSETVAYSYQRTVPTVLDYSGDANGTFNFSYDNDLRPSSSWLSDGSYSTWYERDDDGLDTARGFFTIERGAASGLIDSITDGTGSLSFEHTGLGRLARKTYTVNGATIYDLQIELDLGGRIARRSLVVSGAATVYDYDYDVDGRLTGVSQDGVAVESFEYDSNGNITSAGVVAATYASDDRLLTLGPVGYVFDADGFLVVRGADSFVYGSRGELLRAEINGGESINYTYDAAGRRVARTDSTGTTQYLYGDLGDMYLLTAVRSPDGKVTAYHYDDSALLVAFDRSGSRYYVATDQVGSPAVVADASGSVVKVVVYDSFGGVVSDTNPNFDFAIGFAGGITDAGTGLLRFGQRDYDPAAGRWTARDRLLFGGGNPNLYQYARNDPISYRDPTGLICISFSQYTGAGGGASFCIDENGFSGCVEVGLGTGGGVYVDPFKGAEMGEQWSIDASVQIGPLTLGGNIPLDRCGKAKSTADLGQFGVRGGSEGLEGIRVGGNWKELTDNVGDLMRRPAKLGFEAKVAIKYCNGHAW